MSAVIRRKSSESRIDVDKLALPQPIRQILIVCNPNFQSRISKCPPFLCTLRLLTISSSLTIWHRNDYSTTIITTSGTITLSW